MTKDQRAAIEAICGAAVESIERFPGGDISGASAVKLADGRKFVAKTGPVVSVEAGMLRAMEAASTPSPRVIGCRDDVMVIEHLVARGGLGDAWDGLAEALHGLRELTSETYGWHEDYALRHVRVENAPTESWSRFWAERRLACHVPHLDASLGKRVEKLAAALDAIIPAKPDATFVHGDLWGGNVLASGNRIAGLIDPCACWGDREVDAASLTVFDHPPESFFAALDLEAGWRERQPVYRLWMWLLHVRLFGDSYRPAVERELDTLGF